MNTKLARFAALFAAAVSLTTRAATPALKVGDAPPKLQVAKFVQGEPVADFEKGKAYIVEFWATWCGPCRVSIPHLNELANKYKDKGLVVIGQDCWERDESLVEPFIKKMGDKMTYRIAVDDKEGSKKGKMAENWMEAAGQNGIPTAFFINKAGVIAWIGHPMRLNDQLVEEILEDRFDVKKAAADFLKEGQISATRMEVARHMQKKDWDGALSALAEFEKIADKEDAQFMRLNVLQAKGDYNGAYDLLESLFHKDSDAKPSPAAPQLMNGFAWAVASDKNADEATLAKAEKVADWAVAASSGKDPSILDTQARVLFRQKKETAAILIQEKAVKISDGAMQAALQKTLDAYKRGELPDAQ
jgi:thiol-disulfide isomerase/thioredoxin